MFKIIPEKVLYDKKIPPIAKLIMAEIISFSINSKDCFIGNDKWAQRYGVGKGTISKYISLLHQEEYVIRKIIYKEDSKQIWKRILIAHPNVMYSLSEVAVSLEKQLKIELEEELEEQGTPEEEKQYKRTNLMRDFHKLFKDGKE